MSASRSEYDISYKTDFEIWRENQKFEGQNISKSWPHLDLNPIGINTTKTTTSQLDSAPIGTKTSYPRHWHDQQNCKNESENRMYQRTHIHTHHCQTHHQENIVRLMTASIENPRAKDAIKRRSSETTRNRTCQTLFQATLIHPTKVTKETRDTKMRRSIWENYPIKLFTRLTAKLLTTAYKSKIIKL